METLLNDYGWLLIVIPAIVFGIITWKKGGFKINK